MEGLKIGRSGDFTWETHWGGRGVEKWGMLQCIYN